MNITNSEFSIDLISEKTGLSRSKLFRKLKGLTNMSPVDLVIKIKLNHASELLKTIKPSVLVKLPTHRVLMTQSISAPYLRNSMVKLLKNIVKRFKLPSNVKSRLYWLKFKLYFSLFYRHCCIIKINK